MACVLSRHSCVRLLVTLWTIAHQSPLSIGFSRQEHWSGLPCPPPGYLPNPGLKPVPLKSPALADGFFTTSTTWETLCYGSLDLLLIRQPPRSPIRKITPILIPFPPPSSTATSKTDIVSLFYAENTKQSVSSLPGVLVADTWRRWVSHIHKAVAGTSLWSLPRKQE